MTANPGLRADYNQAKRSNTTQQWFVAAHSRAWEWAEATGWSSLS
jgi:hypothetical protein